MTSVMLATYPEVFAGGAIVAGLPYGAATNLPDALRAMHRPTARPSEERGGAVRRASSHDGPWPKVSVWHGDGDFTVSPANAEAIIDQWTDLLGVAGAARRDTVDGYTYRVWSDAQGQNVLEAYTLAGIGHGTPILTGTSPDACGTPGPFILSAGISSSVRIAEFWGIATKAADDSDVASTILLADAASGVSGWFRRSAPAFKPAARPDGRGIDVGRVISDALRTAGLLK
jgi:poly(3-hydroxybutyrate) depolymerase